jgi:hypothetical protein
MRHWLITDKGDHDRRLGRRSLLPPEPHSQQGGTHGWTRAWEFALFRNIGAMLTCGRGRGVYRRIPVTPCSTLGELLKKDPRKQRVTLNYARPLPPLNWQAPFPPDREAAIESTPEPTLKKTAPCKKVIRISAAAGSESSCSQESLTPKAVTLFLYRTVSFLQYCSENCVRCFSPEIVNPAGES